MNGIPFPDISPVLVEIPLGFTTLPIRWYALAYIVGIVLGFLLVKRTLARPTLWKKESAPLTGTQLDDFLTWLILGIILGGRVGYMLVYGQEELLRDPLSLFRIWDGGMSFHGGFLGVVVAALLFCWRNKVPMAGMADALALGTPPGLFLGRVANFINAELWGRPTDLPWGVIFPGQWAQACGQPVGELCARHPSQLYEAILEGLVLGALLIWMAYARKSLRRPGIICGTFISGYGIARFIVEQFRQADPQFITAENPLGHVWTIGDFGITMGQVLSLPMVGIGLLILTIAMVRR